MWLRFFILEKQKLSFNKGPVTMTAKIFEKSKPMI